MTRNVAALALVAALLVTVAIAQQVKRAGKDVITAGTLDYDWGNNTFEFRGNPQTPLVHVVMTRQYSATMDAPAMSVKLSPKNDRILSFVATGPASFTTAAEVNGEKRTIVASARQQVTFDDKTRLIKLVGEAVADLKPAEGATDVDTIHFTGEAININLETKRLTVDNANLTVETQVPAETKAP